MQTIAITIAGREGIAASFLGGLTLERLAFSGDVPTLPATATLFALDGTALATASLATDDDGAVYADLDSDTQQIADLLRHQPLDATTPAVILIGDADTIQARVPVTIRKNWLDDSTAHPPAPLPAYWTAEQTQAAIAEAVRGLASEADVDSKSAAHNAAEDAHADIREKLADKAESSELVTETEAREQGDADTLDAAKAYADGKVETEAQTRKAQDAETLASAKEYADGKVAGAYRYKGTVATVGDLPASGNAEGDVYNVSADGMNYAWTGTAWDALGASVDLSDYSTTAEADARYLKQTGGNTISGTQNVAGDIKLPAHTLTAGNVVVARPPSSPNNMVRRTDFPDWVLAGDGLTASADDTDKVTLSVKPATASSLGGVKVGEGLTVAEDGTLSATGGGEILIQESPDLLYLKDVDNNTFELDFVGTGDTDHVNLSKVCYGRTVERTLPTKTYVDTALAEKADKSYVDGLVGDIGAALAAI